MPRLAAGLEERRHLDRRGHRRHCAVICAVFAPLLVPHDPFAQDLNKRLPRAVLDGGHDPDFILGTDQLGRDYLSRLIWGCRISMLIGITVTIVSGVIGITIGVLGGFFGGRIDDAVLFAITTRLSIPSSSWRSRSSGLLGTSMTLLVLTLGLLLWDRFAVVARSTTMQVRNLDFVAAAWCAGCSTLPRAVARGAAQYREPPRRGGDARESRWRSCSRRRCRSSASACRRRCPPGA